MTLTDDRPDQPPLSEEQRDEARRVLEVPTPRAGGSASTKTVFAVVDADGTLARGAGAASATKLGTGAYQVLFKKDVDKGAFLATIGLSEDAGQSPPGEIIVNLRTGTTNGVFVQTSNSSGAAEDRSFHLAVVND